MADAISETEPETAIPEYNSEFPLLGTPLERRDKRNRSSSGTPSPGAERPPQPIFKEIPYNQVETADNLSLIRSTINNSPPGSVERVANRKLVSKSTFIQTEAAMNRNEINERPQSKPYRCYQDKSFPKAENETCASTTFTIQRLNEGLTNCDPKPERLYIPTYRQLLINCRRKDANLLTIRDYINGNLNQELATAIDNKMTIEVVSEEVTGKIQKITRQEAEKSSG